MRDRLDSRQGAERIREFVLRGIRERKLRPGDRLPTERELVARYGAARSAVRKVLGELAAEGLVVRTVGRGTEVAGLAAAAPAAAGADTSPGELMQARLLLEPAVVELAVTHATEADFERMDECIERAERAGSISEFEQWDDALHRALAASAHNALVGRLYEMVSQARSNTGWGRLKQRSLTPERRLAYQQEHRRVVAALRQRDAARARARMLEHLRHVRRSLLDE